MLGPQKGRLIPCARKPKNHSWHPENETCRDCPPVRLPEFQEFVWPGYDPFGYLTEPDDVA